MALLAAHSHTRTRNSALTHARNSSPSHTPVLFLKDLHLRKAVAVCAGGGGGLGEGVHLVVGELPIPKVKILSEILFVVGLRHDRDALCRY